MAAKVAEMQLAKEIQETARLVERGQFGAAQVKLKKARRDALVHAKGLGKHARRLTSDAGEAGELLEQLETAEDNPTLRKASIKSSKAKAYSIERR